jgi:hypothetical protein
MITMSRTTLNRLSGVALMLAFVLSLVGGQLHPVIEHQSHTLATMGQATFPLAHLLIFFGGALLLIGLPAVYARIAERTGIVGLTGFALYFLANATLIQFFAGYESFVAPTLAANPATHQLAHMDGPITAAPAFAALQGVGGIVFMLGMLLLGIAVARSRTLPLWSGVMLAIAPVLMLLPIPELPIVTGLIIELPRGLAVATMGYALIAGERGAAQPARAAGDEASRAHSPAV